MKKNVLYVLILLLDVLLFLKIQQLKLDFGNDFIIFKASSNI